MKKAIYEIKLNEASSKSQTREAIYTNIISSKGRKLPSLRERQSTQDDEAEEEAAVNLFNVMYTHYEQSGKNFENITASAKDKQN